MKCSACGASTQPWIRMPIDGKKDKFTPFGNVVHCPACGLGQIDPLPHADEIAGLYELESYYTHGESHMRPVSPGLLDKVLVKFAWQADDARPFDVDQVTALLPDGGSILDIGCGHGELLEALCAAGYDTLGIDPDPASREVAGRKGLLVLAGTAEQLPLELLERQFDLVIMSHSLEHCLDPALALSNVRHLLSPSGYAYIEVPNAGCRHFAMFRECSEMFDAPRHLWFFTSDALQRSLAGAGLSVEQWHYNGFTRLFTRSWREWECEIFARLRKRGLATNSRRHSRARSFMLLLASARAEPMKKYDSIGALVRGAPTAPKPLRPASAASRGHKRAARRTAGGAAALIAFALATASVEPPRPANARIAETIASARPWTPAAARGTGQLSDAFTPAAYIARVVNAQVPLAPGRLTVARPFYLSGSGPDWSRAVDCLAAAAYYEAGSGALDQRAVVQVVLNRLRHAAFPKSVCGVVFEGSTRSTGCQFTFTCDGAMRRRQPSMAAWTLARQTASEMLAGRIEPAVGQATHYHTDWVMPAWNREMDKLAVIKTHLFFAWRGSRGDASAFLRPYRGPEPRISALSALSAGHATMGDSMTGNAVIETAYITPLETPPSPATGLVSTGERLPAKSARPDPDVFLEVLPPRLHPDSFVTLARSRCAGLTACRFLGWSDPARAAVRLPMAGQAADAISFTFVRHAGARADQVKWNCQEFPQAKAGHCLTRGT